MKVLAVDLGSVRIGVAVSAGGVLASPRPFVARGGDHAADHAALAAIVGEEGADLVLVGVPRSLDGSLGPAARAALAEVAELRLTLDVAVETADERLTTVSAARALRTRGVATKHHRSSIDSEAAAVLLQSWLDAAASRGADR